MVIRYNFLTVLLAFFCGAFQLSAHQVVQQQTSSVTLSVIGARAEERDADGNLVCVVDPGQRIKVSVTSTGSGGTQGSKPVIQGIDAFQNVFVGQSSNLVSINGRVTNTMRVEYQLDCSDEGTFKLGPATTNNGSSNVCYIKVVQRTQQESDKDFEQDYKRGVSCQARLTVERDSYFLGEDIPVTLEIYCWDQHAEIEQIQPQFDGFSVKELPHTVTSAEIDERPVRIVQKKYILSSLWSGVKKIKPLMLVYNVPAHQMDDDFPFGMMQGAFLFGPSRSVRQMEARTNGLELTINPLPKGDRNPDGIGTFSALTLSLDKNFVAPRTPINLSLKVVGKGNFAQVSAPRLKLPKTLRSFPGTTESDVVKNDATGESEKRFTYVVQPLKAGNIKIPAQDFLYFDPESASYKTITSREETIVVESDEEEAASEEKETLSRSKKGSEGVEKTVPEEQPSQKNNTPAAQAGVENRIPPQLVKGFKIPWMLWYVLATLVTIFGFLYQDIISFFAWHRRNPKKALKLALHDLETVGKNEADQLFGIAIEYFSLKFFKGDRGSLPLESIELLLEERRFPRGKLVDFMKFLTSLAGIAFGSLRPDKHRLVELRVELSRWLTEIDAY